MTTTWPVLTKRKMKWHFSYDKENLRFNCVTTGGEAPLSKCCKMCINFQISKDLGGRVVCMEGLCARNPMETFFPEQDILQRLWKPEIQQEVSFQPTFRKRNISDGYKR